MPTARPPSAELRAASIGPALEGLRGEGRVHSVFRSVLNMEIFGSDILASLSCSESPPLPYAIALRDAEDFGPWGLERGAPVSVSASRLVIGRPPLATVVLEGAVHTRKRELPSLGRTGPAYALCLESLSRTQANKSCELRMEGLLLSPLDPDRASSGLMGEKLEVAARDLGAAALAAEIGGDAWSAAKLALDEAVARLVGFGQGLTPSGDDFLCGFLAAARCAGREALQGALREAVEARLASTNDISATILRCATRGFFPSALVDTARAMADRPRPASGDGEGAMRGLSAVCALGHSSGSDMATGFLYGLGTLTGSLSIDEFAPHLAATTRRYYASEVPLCEAEG